MINEPWVRPPIEKRNGSVPARPPRLRETGGFRNGDVVRSVDGLDIRSVDDVLGANTALRGAKEARIIITRRGRDMELRYRVVKTLP